MWFVPGFQASLLASKYPALLHRAHVLRDGPASGPLYLLFSVIGMLFAGKLQASPLFSFKSLLQCHHYIIEGLFKVQSPLDSSHHSLLFAWLQFSLEFSALVDAI